MDVNRDTQKSTIIIIIIIIVDEDDDGALISTRVAARVFTEEAKSRNRVATLAEKLKMSFCCETVKRQLAGSSGRRHQEALLSCLESEDSLNYRLKRL